MWSVIGQNVVMQHMTVLSGENQITGRKACPCVPKSTTNPHGTEPRSLHLCSN